MAGPKAKKKKKQQQKHGVDFKKIKRKVGRKLSAPKNATNIQIKSKAIILPEQSVATEKAGSATSKKGLVLDDLLKQTSHYNSKVRRDALTGIKELILKHPGELKAHKFALIEKLSQRIGDEDRLVKETLYELLKLDIQGSLILRMMTYIFRAMTHFSVEARLMAFKFLDLVVQNNSSTFLFYAEKILQNYEDIPRSDLFNMQDKSKVKNALLGLVRCLSILLCKSQEDGSHDKSESDEIRSQLDMVIWDQTVSPALMKLLADFPLHSTDQLSATNQEKHSLLDAEITEIFFNFQEWIDLPTAITNKYLPYIEMLLVEKTSDGKRVHAAIREKQLLSFFPYIPKLLSQHVSDDWKYSLLQAFTQAFMDCSSESKLKFACISILEKMLIHGAETFLDPIDPAILDHQITWIRELPELLVALGDKHPSSSKVVLRLINLLGGSATVHPSFLLEYEGLKSPFQAFFSTSDGEVMGDIPLLLQLLEEIIVGQLQLKPDIENARALLQVICTLDSEPTRLSVESLAGLSDSLPSYLLDIVHASQENKMTLVERHKIQRALDQLSNLSSQKQMPWVLCFSHKKFAL
ncbi:hypothetical protein CDL15_Pgr016806 [Punica granatum]|uniref:Pre-rRNA-processing protein Ipi1 N-terminal domain-containing protein n=1 Tax=Punica granatum TaxID=22663 RepID=A0A218WY14_PUNGR|nr:hypothetical protein CDL15_Pgr016806 [Punica granatum]